MDDIEKLLAETYTPYAKAPSSHSLRTPDGQKVLDQKLDTLLFLLQSEKPEVQQEAAELLGEIRDIRAVEPLLKILPEAEPDVCQQIITALGQIGDARAFEPLLTFLTDDNYIIRASTLEALGSLGDERCIPPICNCLLQDRSYLVRATAAEVLARFQTPEVVTALKEALNDGDRWVRNQVVESLCQCDPDTPLWSLLRDLNHPESTVRLSAIQRLGQLGDSRSIPFLEHALLEEEQTDIIEAVVETLGRIKDPRGVEILVRAALISERPQMREKIIKFIQMIGEEQVVPILTQALDSPDVDIRQHAIEMLRQLKTPLVLNSLQYALGHADEWIRTVATIALGEREAAFTQILIWPMLQDPSERVVQAAAEALAHQANSASIPVLLSALNSPFAWTRQVVAQALSVFDSPEVRLALERMTHDPDANVREAAVRALARSHHENSISILIAALADEETWVRQAATEALSNYQKPEVLSALIATLQQDEDFIVRTFAAQAVGNFRDERALLALIKALRDSASGVRQRAAIALGLFKDSQTLQPLIEALKDSDAKVVQAAAESLGFLADPQAVSALNETLHHPEPWVRMTVVQSLGRIHHPDSLHALIDALDDCDSWVKIAAIEALSSLENPVIVTPLIQILAQNEDFMIRAFAAAALGRQKDARACETLIHALHDEHDNVRQEATKALLKIGFPQGLQALQQLLAEGHCSPTLCAIIQEGLAAEKG